MSGGGARGAYEVGVLSFVLDDLPRRLGRPLPVDIVTGTSVGAIHACYVGATCGVDGTSALSSWARDPFVVAREARLGPRHALASAAIPFLLPALRVDGSFYCDGGLRLNTPLAPALRLGADRLLIVGLRHVPTPQEEAALAAHRESNYPTLAYLTGKVLNALLIDHVDHDVDRMTLMNAILEAGARAYGPEFLARVNQAIEGIRGNPYRIVRHVYLQPSRALGLIASECIDRRSGGRGLRSWLGDRLVQFAAHGIQADLLSYLFFDRGYTEELIALGRRDAEERADDIATLFGDVSAGRTLKIGRSVRWRSIEWRAAAYERLQRLQR